jgi:hypothetical protein
MATTADAAPVRINMTQDETLEMRATRLLRQLLPAIGTRDQAIENLFYRTPDANESVRLWSIAAAVFILSQPKEERT